MPSKPEPLRALISRYYGDACTVIAVRRAGASSLFVVEATMRGRLVRLLGTVGRTREVMEHSAMDMLTPERLVFPYERMMLMSLALAAERKRALLLGLGGGAMLRHLAAYFPKLAVTVVERDPAVIALAREHFHIDAKILRADAEEVVADFAGTYDAVMVDLYDAGGAAPLGERFWRDCGDALKPGGCLAINWAGGWTGAEHDGTTGERVRRAMPLLPHAFLVAERGPRGNFVQLAPNDPAFRIADLEKRLTQLAASHKLPREDREILQRCSVTAGKGAAKLKATRRKA